MRRLSTTSFALLGLLSFRDWTASELTKQMERSLNFVWPRAVSGIYVEPASLRDHGLVDATEVPESRRVRARYSITAAGRRALLAWIRQPSAASTFESESALKLIFVDVATKDDALRIIDEISDDARQRNDQLLEIFADYAEGRGAFPDRAHVVGLASRLYHEHYAAMASWAEWARAEVEGWPSTDRSASAHGRSIVQSSRRRFGSRSRHFGKPS